MKYSVLLFLIFIGCFPIYQKIPAKKVQELEPKWVPLMEGVNVSYNAHYKYHPSEMELSNGMLLEQEVWEGYLKRFVESFEISQREDLLQGLTRYYIEYDQIDQCIKFEPLRYLSSPYGLNSYISFKGALKDDKAAALVKILYFGDSWVFVNRLKFVIDNFTCEVNNFEVLRANSSTVCEYAFFDIEIPLIYDIITKIIDSKKSFIRFLGNQYYSDLVVTERMKADLKAMLKVIHIVNQQKKVVQ